MVSLIAAIMNWRRRGAMLQPIIDQFRLTWRLLRDPRVPVWTKAIPLGTLLYVVSPLDFLTDLLPLIGLVDDFAIVAAGLRLFESAAPDYVVAEHRAALDWQNAQAEAAERRQEDVVDSTATSATNGASNPVRARSRSGR
jgi:uncharacterized membrane protein YkvA (DUF1232 family)